MAADTTSTSNKMLQDIQNFYGKQIKTAQDFKVTSCPKKCNNRKDIEEAIKLIHTDIKERNYGCGIVVPVCLEGLSVLDLGCGAGMDCFILSKLIGPSGCVTGIDVTEEQLHLAEKYADYHSKAFGYTTSNTCFLKGVIEDLKAAGIKENSQDLVISNCVICLSEDKKAVLQEAFQVLKPGGELYFSDMYCSKRVPQSLLGDEEMWGEGLTGALYWKDLFSIAEEIGFMTPLLFETSGFEIHDEYMKAAVDKHGLNYVSATFRLFKCEQRNSKHGSLAVTYRGGIPNNENEFVLAKNTIFKKNEMQLCHPDVHDILQQSRFSKFFEFSKYSLQIDPFQDLKERHHDANI